MCSKKILKHDEQSNVSRQFKKCEKSNGREKKILTKHRDPNWVFQTAETVNYIRVLVLSNS